MEEIFISNIHINKVRHLENIDIFLSDTERKHLILTGKNGSGKTSVLLSIKNIFTSLQTNEYNNIPIYKAEIEKIKKHISNLRNELSKYGITEHLKDEQKRQINQGLENIKNYEEILNRYNMIDINFNNEIELPTKYKKGEFLLSFFNAKRTTELQIPTGINKINLKEIYEVEERANKNFVQYIVNLKADRSFARDDTD